MVTAIRRVHLEDRKTSKDLILTLGLNEEINQVAMANSVRCYGHVLRRATEFGANGKWKKREREKN